MALAGAGDLTVVAEAGDGAEAVDLARRLLPDVVVMDVRLPRMDGLAATRAIAGAGLPVRVLILTAFSHRVLILTAFSHDEQVLGAVTAGAVGFLPKDAAPNAEIARALTVSETTIKTHVGHLLTKLGLRDRVQAVVLAYESGLVKPGA
jgi:DNA-binding NarL/FixJ family response regulator